MRLMVSSALQDLFQLIAWQIKSCFTMDSSFSPEFAEANKSENEEQLYTRYMRT